LVYEISETFEDTKEVIRSSKSKKKDIVQKKKDKQNTTQKTKDFIYIYILTEKVSCFVTVLSDVSMVFVCSDCDVLMNTTHRCSSKVQPAGVICYNGTGNNYDKYRCCCQLLPLLNVDITSSNDWYVFQMFSFVCPCWKEFKKGNNWFFGR
jgi:hypothetical protein